MQFYCENAHIYSDLFIISHKVHQHSTPDSKRDNVDKKVPLHHQGKTVSTAYYYKRGIK